MNHSEHLGELFKALAAAQAELEPAKKDEKNPFFKSSYAGLPSVIEAAKRVLPKHGLSILQFAGSDERGDYLETILGHSSGQWWGGKLHLHPKAQDPQGIGSALTYMRRYSYMAAIGLAADDDDGEVAMGREDMVKGVRSALDTMSAAKKAEKPTIPNVPFNPANSPVAPSQAPGEGSGYVITFGKYKGRKISSVPKADLQSYLNFLDSQCRETGKPMNAGASEFFKNAVGYLNPAGIDDVPQEWNEPGASG